MTLVLRVADAGAGGGVGDGDDDVDSPCDRAAMVLPVVVVADARERMVGFTIKLTLSTGLCRAIVGTRSWLQRANANPSILNGHVKFVAALRAEAINLI